MSDLNRDAMASRFGQATSRTTAVVDEGLRAYMLHIYNYMVLGLAITGFAALGIYMLSMTGDAASAAKVLRNGVEMPAQIRGGVFLTPLGYALFVSPLKWAVILAPLALVFVLSFGIERLRPPVAQLLFWVFSALIGISLASIFMIYTQTSIVRVFFITGASIGIVGTLAGLILGVLVCQNIEEIRQFVSWATQTTIFPGEVYFLSRMPAEMDAGEVTSIVVMALTLSILATLYPSWRAARLDPVEALRYE